MSTEGRGAWSADGGPAGRLTAVVRTCVGCRQRAEATSLVRVVAEPGATPVVLVPDLRRSLPGRGAHLHPTPECLELARRRRAWGRALRVEGPINDEAVSRLITPAEHHRTTDPPGSTNDRRNAPAFPR